MSSNPKIFRKVHYQNISDSGGESICLVGKVNSFDRDNRKLVLDVLGKIFEVNNVDTKKKVDASTISKTFCFLFVIIFRREKTNF